MPPWSSAREYEVIVSYGCTAPGEGHHLPSAGLQFAIHGSQGSLHSSAIPQFQSTASAGERPAGSDDFAARLLLPPRCTLAAFPQRAASAASDAPSPATTTEGAAVPSARAPSDAPNGHHASKHALRRAPALERSSPAADPHRRHASEVDVFAELERWVARVVAPPGSALRSPLHSTEGVGRGAPTVRAVGTEPGAAAAADALLRAVETLVGAAGGHPALLDGELLFADVAAVLAGALTHLRVSNLDVDYFVSMVDLDGDGFVAVTALEHELADCSAIHSAVGALGPPAEPLPIPAGRTRLQEPRGDGAAAPAVPGVPTPAAGVPATSDADGDVHASPSTPVAVGTSSQTAAPALSAPAPPGSAAGTGTATQAFALPPFPARPLPQAPAAPAATDSTPVTARGQPSAGSIRTAEDVAEGVLPEALHALRVAAPQLRNDLRSASVRGRLLFRAVKAAVAPALAAAPSSLLHSRHALRAVLALVRRDVRSVNSLPLPSVLRALRLGDADHAADESTVVVPAPAKQSAGGASGQASIQSEEGMAPKTDAMSPALALTEGDGTALTQASEGNAVDGVDLEDVDITGDADPVVALVSKGGLEQQGGGRRVLQPLCLAERSLLDLPCVWWPCLLAHPSRGGQLPARLAAAQALWREQQSAARGVALRRLLLPAARDARGALWRRMTDAALASGARATPEADAVTGDAVGGGLRMPTPEEWMMWHPRGPGSAPLARGRVVTGAIAGGLMPRGRMPHSKSASAWAVTWKLHMEWLVASSSALLARLQSTSPPAGGSAALLAGLPDVTRILPRFLQPAESEILTAWQAARAGMQLPSSTRMALGLEATARVVHENIGDVNQITVMSATGHPFGCPVDCVEVTDLSASPPCTWTAHIGLQPRLEAFLPWRDASRAAGQCPQPPSSTRFKDSVNSYLTHSGVSACAAFRRRPRRTPPGPPGDSDAPLSALDALGGAYALEGGTLPATATLTAAPDVWTETELAGGADGRHNVSVYTNSNAGRLAWRPVAAPPIPDSAPAHPSAAAKPASDWAGRTTGRAAPPDQTTPRAEYLTSPRVSHLVRAVAPQITPLPLPQGSEERPAVVDGAEARYGLAVRPRGGHHPGLAAYDLAGRLVTGSNTVVHAVDLVALRAAAGFRATHFCSAVALDESAGRRRAVSPIRFAVLLDDELVWASPGLQAVGDVASVVVPLGAARRLLLAVETAQSCCVCGLWVDPHVLESPPEGAGGAPEGPTPLPPPRRVVLVRHEDTGTAEFVPAEKERSATTSLYVNVVMCAGASARLNGSLLIRLHGYRERVASHEDCGSSTQSVSTKSCATLDTHDREISQRSRDAACDVTIQPSAGEMLRAARDSLPRTASSGATHDATSTNRMPGRSTLSPDAASSAGGRGDRHDAVVGRTPGAGTVGVGATKSQWLPLRAPNGCFDGGKEYVFPVAVEQMEVVTRVEVQVAQSDGKDFRVRFAVPVAAPHPRLLQARHQM